jgi:hypothetical protein
MEELRNVAQQQFGIANEGCAGDNPFRAAALSHAAVVIPKDCRVWSVSNQIVSALLAVGRDCASRTLTRLDRSCAQRAASSLAPLNDIERVSYEASVPPPWF